MSAPLFLYPGEARPVDFDGDPAYDESGLQWLPAERTDRFESAHHDRSVYSEYAVGLHPGVLFDPQGLQWLESVPAAQAVVEPGTDFSRYSAAALVVVPALVEPPDVGAPGQGSLQIPRVPARAGVLDPDRMRRHTEAVELVLNSLLRRGRISRVGSADEFELIAPGFAANRDPGPDDDEAAGAVAGVTWVNKSSQKLFFCVDATEGAAVWVAAN